MVLSASLPRRVLLGVSILCLAQNASASHSAARQWNEEILAAIRRNVPDPPGHARNLFHLAAAMWNAWAAYDPVAIGYVHHEKVQPLPNNIENARKEAISYAAYRVLRARFASGAGAATSVASFKTRMDNLGYSWTVAEAAITSDSTPAELGKRCGQAILDWGANDGFNQTAYPQAYDWQVNINMLYPMSVLGKRYQHDILSDYPLGFGAPNGTDPNLWQPLSLSAGVTQNGIPIPGGTQPFVGVSGLATTPFSLKRADNHKPWLDPFGGPSKLTLPGKPSSTDSLYRSGALEVVKASSQLNDATLINISPGGLGNNPLGSDAGTGFPTNPVTHGSYAPQFVKLGDYVRVLAEFWADGPNSETPPGHWHVLANQLADNPTFQKRIGGIGPIVNDLEWDVKTYFALAAAVHDAGCAAWALKRFYSGCRPITMIRYLAQKGQSSDPSGPSYHPQGLPLQAGVAEVITAASSAAGQRHETIYTLRDGVVPGWWYTGSVVVYSWPGEHPNNLPAPSIATNQSLVRWMLGRDWLPFQRKTFNTPAFPGYISGHSTFSRAAAETLTKITGSPYWPGGFHHHLVTANSLQIDLGPSTDVDLQWCTYYDCADQAGQSRIWGGIHVKEDDYHGRIIGSQVGISAYNLASQYWNGSVVSNPFDLKITNIAANQCTIKWENVRGMYHKLQASTDTQNWTDLTPYTLSYDTKGSYVDTSPIANRKFYRVKRSAVPFD